MALPQFSPLGGIGSTWKDPKTGEVYRYIAQGWVKESGDIKKEVAEQGTFEIRPEEQELVRRYKEEGGLNQAQINSLLEQRRRAGASPGEIDKTEQKIVEEANLDNPFFDPGRGRLLTRQEAILDAYNQGVKPSQLGEIGEMYDLLAGDGEDEETEIEAFARSLNAQQINISNVPSDIRGKVLDKSKDLAISDLEEDIQLGFEQKIKQSDLLEQLTIAYPEFSKQEIESKILEFKPVEREKETEKEKQSLFGLANSFFSRLFGRQ